MACPLTAGTCEQCGGPLPEKTRAGGRVQRYCSDVCRARANRAKKRGTAPTGTQARSTPQEAGPVTWEPEPQPPPDIEPPPPCHCGQDRTWTPNATAAICPVHGLQLLLAEAGTQEVAAEQRIVTPEEDLLADLELGAQIGRLQERISDLLKLGDLSGEGRGWLDRLHKHAGRAKTLAEIATYSRILDTELAASTAGGDDDQDVPEGEAISDSWHDDTAFADTGPSALTDGGLDLAQIPARDHSAPRPPRPRRPCRQPVTRRWHGSSGSSSAKPVPANPPCGLWHPAVRYLPASPVRDVPDRGAQVISFAQAQRERAELQQPALQQLLDAGLVHEAIALATGRRPEYPGKQLAVREGWLAAALLPKRWRRGA